MRDYYLSFAQDLASDPHCSVIIQVLGATRQRTVRGLRSEVLVRVLALACQADTHSTLR